MRRLFPQSTARFQLPRLLAFAAVTLAIGLLCGFLASCSGPQNSSESHFGSNKAFLRVCEDGVCETGDDCSCGVCTIDCRQAEDCALRILGPDRSVDELPANVVCRAPVCVEASSSQEVEVEVEQGAQCDVTCVTDEDCDFLEEKEDGSFEHFCNAGLCRTVDEPEKPVVPEADAPLSLCPEGRALIPSESTPGPLAQCLDEGEVTVAEYRACVEDGSCNVPEAGNYLTTGRDTHPVQFISAAQAESYCAFAGARLPTRDEWRSATEGSADYPWGTDAPTVNDVPQLVCGLSAGATCPVESFPLGAGPFGHNDLSGNVAELVTNEDAICAVGGAFYDEAPELLLNTCVPFDTPNEAIGFRCISDL